MKSKMEQVLTDLLKYLKESEDSIYANETVEQLKDVVSQNLLSVMEVGCLSNAEKMSNMFLPTASLQDTAIENGWGDQYVELASQFELALAARS